LSILTPIRAFGAAIRSSAALPILRLFLCLNYTVFCRRCPIKNSRKAARKEKYFLNKVQAACQKGEKSQGIAERKAICQIAQRKYIKISNMRKHNPSRCAYKKFVLRNVLFYLMSIPSYSDLCLL
ncbi:MAG: hypothetical protein RSD27_07435, partial [Ruthenibacterium sp.]